MDLLLQDLSTNFLWIRRNCSNSCLIEQRFFNSAAQKHWFSLASLKLAYLVNLQNVCKRGWLPVVLAQHQIVPPTPCPAVVLHLAVAIHLGTKWLPLCIQALTIYAKDDSSGYKVSWDGKLPILYLNNMGTKRPNLKVQSSGMKKVKRFCLYLVWLETLRAYLHNWPLAVRSGLSLQTQTR